MNTINFNELNCMTPSSGQPDYQLGEAEPLSMEDERELARLTKSLRLKNKIGDLICSPAGLAVMTIILLIPLVIFAH